MAKIKINTADVINSSPKANSAKAIISGVVDGICSTRRRTDLKILNQNGIGGRLDNVQSRLIQIERDIIEICRAAEVGAACYQSTENKIVDMGRTVGSINNK